MDKIALTVNKISKKYFLRSAFSKDDMLRGAMSKMFKISRAESVKNAIWALKDVSFEVKYGETVGIIGRNGAGKSTLLKILSRITVPTSGRAVIYGSTASLLEVGTGFHEELSGRDNVYLNGAILGMKRSEIKRKFNNIVDFSGAGAFIDTPVKFYSSGMYLRLAFAIAVHLQPEILLIDEILAVGDIEFQKKCFGRMNEIASEGKTVIIVSHSMSPINAFCNKAILLNKGEVVSYGDRKEVVNCYLESIFKLTTPDLNLRSDRAGNGSVRFTRYWLEDRDNIKVAIFHCGEEAVICVEYKSYTKDKLQNAAIAFSLKDSLGNQITNLTNEVAEDVWQEIPSDGIIKCKISRLPLMPGKYIFSVYVKINGFVSDYIIDAGCFEVVPGHFFQSGRLPSFGSGNILIEHSWGVVNIG